MRGVSELAHDLGYTRQYVHQVIKKLPKSKQPKKVGQKYVLTLQNERDIKDLITKAKGEPKSERSTILQKELTVKDGYIKHLQTENEYLHQELARSQELQRHEQELRLQADEKTRFLETEKEETAKKGFWSKLFGH